MKKSLLAAAVGLLLFSGTVGADETAIPKFDINRIFLEGNTILTPADVASILNKYTGPQKDFGALQEAMESLEAAYRSRGYSMVTVLLPDRSWSAEQLSSTYWNRQSKRSL